MNGWVYPPLEKEETILLDFNSVSINIEFVNKRLDEISKQLEPEFKAKLEADGYVMQSYIERRVYEELEKTYEKSQAFLFALKTIYIMRDINAINFQHIWEGCCEIDIVINKAVYAINNS